MAPRPQIAIEEVASLSISVCQSFAVGLRACDRNTDTAETTENDGRDGFGFDLSALLSCRG